MLTKADTHFSYLNRKIVDEDGIRRLRASWRLKEKSIAFTNGCFDLLHVGHLHTFLYAADRADIVVVGINKDDSVKRLKGPDRPIVGEEQRAQMLAALAIIDAVVPFAASTPLQIIKDLEPDLLVKGGDYAIDQIVGADVVQAYGGRVETVPFLEGWSTTDLAKRLSKQ